MKDRLFRKVSLERLSSPEQLDELMQVTTGKGWIALTALSAILLTAVFWGILGSIPSKVSGQGMIIKTGGVFDIVTLGKGQIMEILVESGDMVEKGQIVAKIAQPRLEEELKKARSIIEELQANHRELQKFGSKDLRLQSEYLAQQRRNLENAIETDRQQLAWMEEKVAAQEALYNKGLITRQALLGSKQNVSSIRENIDRSLNELKQIDVRSLTLKNSRQQELLSSQIRLNDAERQIQQLLNELELHSKVTSAYNGRIIERMANVGEVVNSGTAIFKLELSGQEAGTLVAVLYIPPAEGKKVKPGMEIQISPSTVKQEEYGFMIGEVLSVADFPSTRQGMNRVLKNDQLVRALSIDGAPFEVYAELKIDNSSSSGYRWSSAGGPATKIYSGTMCESSIIVREQRPISMVVPILKENLGI